RGEQHGTGADRLAVGPGDLLCGRELGPDVLRDDRSLPQVVLPLAVSRRAVEGNGYRVAAGGRALHRRGVGVVRVGLVGHGQVDRVGDVGTGQRRPVAPLHAVADNDGVGVAAPRAAGGEPRVVGVL